MKVVDLVILGSGPAGWTAALYAARAGLNPVVISGFAKGGQLTTTTDVDNWPGAADGIDGTELVNQMERHAVRFGTEVIDDEITEVDLSRNNTDKVLLLKGVKEYACKSLIICTGATAKYLGLPSEDKFAGRGVSACATCDGFFYKEQEVAVVGGGNTAVEEAIYLSKIAKRVHLIHRRDTFKAEQVMIKHLMSLVQEGKIVLHLNSVVDEIVGDKSGVNGILIKEKDKNEDLKRIDLQGVFIAIGHTPKTEMFKGQLLMDGGGFLITQKSNNSVTQTNIDGVFAAGDVQDPIYRQAVTSAGAGCQAALDAAKFLESWSE